MNDEKPGKNKKNLVNNFFGNKEDEKNKEGEPIAKKTKVSQDPDDSLKYFKSVEPKTTTKSSSPAVVSRFFKKTDTKKNAPSKTASKSNKKAAKQAKTQPDIRKALSKHDLMLQTALDESFRKDDVDPFEMQLALAISESLKDQQTLNSDLCEPSTSSASTSAGPSSRKKLRLENPFSSSDGSKVCKPGDLLSKYGNEKVLHDDDWKKIMDNMQKAKRTRGKRKLPTKLTLTKHEDRDRRNSLFLKAIANEMRNHETSEDTRVQYMKVVCDYLQELQLFDNTIFQKHSLATKSDLMLNEYYVRELFEPSYVNAGYLLKNWKDIYGRLRSPSPEGKEIEIPQEGDIILENSSGTEKSNDSLSVSQLEAILLESDEEEGHKSSDFKTVQNADCSEKDLIQEKDDLNGSCSDIFGDFESSDDGFKSSVIEKSGNENINAETTTPSLKSDHIASFNEHLNLINDKISQNADQSTDVDDKIETFSLRSSSNDTVEYSIDNAIKIQNCSAVEIDLTKEEKSLSDVESYVENEENHAIKSESQTIDLTQESGYSNSNSQLCGSDQIIDISDDEINYSVQAFNNDDHSPEQADDVLEVDNIVEQSLMEILAENEHANVIPFDEINASVNLCVEETRPFEKNQTTRQLSSSILEILNKYKQPEKEMTQYKPEEFIDEPIEYEAYKPKSEEKDNENEIEMCPVEHFNSNDESISEILRKYKLPEKENLEAGASGTFEEEQLSDQIPEDEGDFDQDLNTENHPVRKSLDNILNNSIAKTPAKRKSKNRRSLGINLNTNKYDIDMESEFIEPHYASMTPVELKRELYKYGIRTLPVRKAVELLTHIFEETHPKIRVKASEEIDEQDSRIDMNATDFVTNIGQDSHDDFVFELNDCGTLDEEEYILPKMKKSKTPSCLVPLHISFYNMVRSNEKFQRFILEFRPLDLDEIYRHFRKFNLSYQLNDIISFLDKRCITFKTKEQSCSNRYQKKKKRKDKASQQT